jgi:hypothetical protein
MYCIPYHYYRSSEIKKLFRVNKKTKQTVFIQDRYIFPQHQQYNSPLQLQLQLQLPSNKPKSLLAQVLYQTYLKGIYNDKKMVKLLKVNNCSLNNYLDITNKIQNNVLSLINKTTNLSINKLEDTITDELTEFSIYKINNYFMIYNILELCNLELLTFETITVFLNYLDVHIKYNHSFVKEYKLFYEILNYIARETFIRYTLYVNTYDKLECIYRLFNKLEEFNNLIYEKNIPIAVYDIFYYRKWMVGENINFVIIKI